MLYFLIFSTQYIAAKYIIEPLFNDDYYLVNYYLHVYFLSLILINKIHISSTHRILSWNQCLILDQLIPSQLRPRPHFLLSHTLI